MRPQLCFLIPTPEVKDALGALDAGPAAAEAVSSSGSQAALGQFLPKLVKQFDNIFPILGCIDNQFICKQLFFLQHRLEAFRTLESSQ